MGKSSIDLEFEGRLRKFIAGSSINPSSSRNSIRKGTINDFRKFLRENVQLNKIPKSSREQYIRWLDRTTRRLQRCSKKRLSWGTARKFLNLYLRDVTYNYFLRKSIG